MQALAGRDGIALIPDLPDLRDEIARHAVVVLPFVSGGGIKNKLLEAASLGRAIVGSATAMNGLNPPEQPPWVRADGESAWIRGILALWRDPEGRHRVGQQARDWVIQNHSWTMAAERALAGLDGTT